MGTRSRVARYNVWGLFAFSLLLLQSARAQDAAKDMPPSAVEDLEDWVADGNVMSPSRKAREDSDSCAPLREQLAARENQVNELLREKTKAQGHTKENEELQASLKSAQQRLSAAQTELKALKASSSESTDATAVKAAEAQAELASMKLKLKDAEQKLTSQQGECQNSEKALQDAQAKVEALSGDLQTAMAAQKKLQESTDLTSRADKRALKDAQAALTRAQSDADKASSALTQAQTEALSTLQSLDDWFGATLPSWAAEKFGQASEVASPTVRSLSEKVQPYWESTYNYIEPHTNVAYDRGSQYGRAGWEAGSKYASQAYKTSGEYANKAYAQGSQYGQQAYSYGRATGMQAWLQAHPHMRQAYTTVQALLQKAWQAVRTSVGPHMSVAGGYLERGFREVRRRTHGLTSNPTQTEHERIGDMAELVQLRRNAASAWAEMEPAVATAMRQVDVLKPYARKPYTTWVLYLGISFPTMLFLVPFLLALGASNKPPQLPEQSGDSSLPQGLVPPGSSGPASQSSNARRTKAPKQEGSFSDGGETVRFSTKR